MAMKLALFVSLMVAAVAVPISGSQRMGHLIEIHGTVYCPGNSNRNASGTNKGIFPGKFAQVNYFTYTHTRTHTHIYIYIYIQFPSKLSMQGFVYINIYLVRVFVLVILFLYIYIYIWYFCSQHHQVFFVFNFLTVAEIHVVCDGKAIEYGYTDASGGFLFTIDYQRHTIPKILKTCKLVVIAALTRCPKPSPSAGHLESNLKYMGDFTVGGDLKVSSIVPVGFHVVP